MIPTDRIHDNGDGTLWVVESALPDSPSGWPATRNDRPCDTCDGVGDQLPSSGDWHHCPDCHGTGRHVFEINLACIRRADLCPHDNCGTLLVHVVPDMVLEIMEDEGATEPQPWWVERHIITNGDLSLLVYDLNDSRESEYITLPPAAKPGMYAIKLEEL